jgi:acetylglutamate kinase
MITTVLKLGGELLEDAAAVGSAAAAIVRLAATGPLVVVHGGGPEISDMLRKIGKESRFVDGLRYTDAEAMDIVQQVLCGKVNKDLVATLNRLGGKAIGLCGMDGGMLRAKKLDEKYGLVGEIVQVCPDAVNDCLSKGYIPVISTVAQGLDAETAYNINADTAAAKLAIALKAEKLILLTDIRGICEDTKDIGTLIPRIGASEVEMLVDKGIVRGGMIPKVRASAAAIEAGVGSVHILDGRLPHAILMELFTDRGIGTMISA